jgi:hypothetical protein
MLKDISDTKDWSLKRASVGLLSSTDLLSAFDMIIHNTVSPPKPALTNTDVDFSLVCSEPDNAALRLLSSYAKVTENRQGFHGTDRRLPGVGIRLDMLCLITSRCYEGPH